MVIDPGIILSNHLLLTSRDDNYLFSDKRQEIFYILIHTLSTIRRGFSELCGVSSEGVRGGYAQEGGMTAKKKNSS